MEFLIIGRVLRRRWRLAIVGLLVSLAAGALLSHSSATPQFFEATAQVLVDTRTPAVDTSTSVGTNSVTQRAIFLADLVGSAANTAAISHAAGLRPDQVAFVTPSFQPVTRGDTMLPDGQLPQLSAQAAGDASTFAYYQVLLDANYTVPLITITATALNTRQATELTQATIAALRATTQSELATTVAAAEPPAGASATARAQATFLERGIPPQALVVKQLGTLQLGAVPTAASQLPVAIAAAIMLFFMWCTGVALVSRRQPKPRRWARRRMRPPTENPSAPA